MAITKPSNNKAKHADDLVMVETSIPVSLHRKAKVKAIMDAVPLRELVRLAIERYVEAKS